MPSLAERNGTALLLVHNFHRYLNNPEVIQTTFTQLNQIPTAAALSPDGKIWVACNASSSLVVIDPSSNAVIKSIDIGLGDEPTGIAFA